MTTRGLAALALTVVVIVLTAASNGMQVRHQDNPATSIDGAAPGGNPLQPATSTPSDPTTTIPGETTTTGDQSGSTTSTTGTTTSTTTSSSTSSSTAPQTTVPPGQEGDQTPGADEEPGAHEPGVDPNEPDPPGADLGDEHGPARGPGRPASVRSSNIPIGSIALAAFVILAIGAGAWFLVRREEEVAARPDEAPTQQQRALDHDVSTEADSPAGKVRTLNLLLALGEALLDSGIAVPQVETTLKSVARTFGIEGLGAIVLPNSLVLSVPHARDVRTEAGTAGTQALRLDQIDDVTRLVRGLSHGDLTVPEARAELRRIRASTGPSAPRTVVAGNVLSAAALVMILGGTWKEVVLGAALGGLIGVLLVSTRRVENIAYVSFQPLMVASVGSIAVFATTRVLSGLIVFPLLLAPVVRFLPGGKLTMGVLELVTGHIVAGSARVISGLMQLVLLAMGLVAGAQLIGAGEGVRTSTASGPIAGIAPWVGVALFGVGIMWVHGALRSSRLWILVVLYVAYAGQVIGALFFGPSLSAFFGALAMTPVAVLASRQPGGPSPLVTFLPAFWILVPGALGLRGVSLLLGEGGGGAQDTLLVALTSMIGISLGILLGLTLVSRNSSSWWIGDEIAVEDDAHPSDSASDSASGSASENATVTNEEIR